MKTQHPLLGLTRHPPCGEDASVSESPKKFRRLVKPSKHHRLSTAGLIQDTPQRKQAAQASSLEHGGSHWRHKPNEQAEQASSLEHGGSHQGSNSTNKRSKHHLINTAGLTGNSIQRNQRSKHHHLNTAGLTRDTCMRLSTCRGVGGWDENLTHRIPKNPIIRELNGGNPPASIKHRLDCFVTALTSTHSRWPKVPRPSELSRFHQRTVCRQWPNRKKTNFTRLWAWWRKATKT